MWLIVVAVVVLAAIAGGYLLLNHGAGAPLPNSALASPTPNGRPSLAQFTDETSKSQVTIHIEDTPNAPNSAYNFTPRYIIISAHTTVTWDEISIVPHNVIATNKDTFPNSPVLVQQGTNTYAFTFTKAGDYPYFCGIHPAMTGWIIVQ